MNRSPDRIEVFFVGPPNGWTAVPFDADDNQSGDAIFAWLKSDILYQAARHWGDDVERHVYRRNGYLGLIIPPRHSLPERTGTVWSPS